MDSQNQAGTWRTIKRLEKSIPQVRWYRGELMLMSLFINLFALGLPIFILQVYDRILPNLGLTTMQFLVIGLVIVMILDFILKSIRAAVTTYTGARFEHLARVAAVDKILRTPQDVYEQETPGAYLDKVNAIGVVKEFYSSQLGTLFIDLPFAVFFLGMIWFLGGLMVAVPLTLLTLFGIMAIIVGGNLRRAVDIRGQVDNRRYDFLIEIINGIHTVKAQAFKNLLQRRFESLQETSARAVRSVAMQSSIAQSLGSTFGQLNMASVIGLGAVLVIDGNLSAGELAACTLLSGRAMQPLQSAMGLWTNFQTIRVACDNATSVMELPAEDLGARPEMPKITGEIEFRDVSFKYAEMDHSFIKNLNLKFKAGSMIGIEGDNSSGRSTLLKLMIGIIRPTSGQVMIDGHDLAQHKSQSYRSQMAFLSADADVYTGTILDNMTYFRGGKYIKKAIDLAKRLGLDEEIKRLPEGYGTHIGDGAGGVLPAGFAQRITIVRAMVDNPKIVLFDNANHGLDSNTDKILLDYITSLRGKATVILVSARPSWLRAADERYVMSNGDVQPKVEDPPAQLEKPREALPAPDSQQVAQQTLAPAPKVREDAPLKNAESPQPAKREPMTTGAAKPRQSAPSARPTTRPQTRQAQGKKPPTPRPAPAARPKPATNIPSSSKPESEQPRQSRPTQKRQPEPQATTNQKRSASEQNQPLAKPDNRTVSNAVSEQHVDKQAVPTVKPPAEQPAAAQRPTQTKQASTESARTPIKRPISSAENTSPRVATLPEARSAQSQRPRPAANERTSSPNKSVERPQPANSARPQSSAGRPAQSQPNRPTPTARPVAQNRSTTDQQQKPATVQSAGPTSPQETRQVRPAASQPARPVSPSQARTARPVPKPGPTDQRARPDPAQPSRSSAAQDQSKDQKTQPLPPRPAATLRPAAAPGTSKAASGVRPQPPKPRRIDPRDAGLGGAE